MCRNRQTCGTTVLLLNYPTKCIQINFPKTDFKDCSNQCAYHISEKSVGFNRKYYIRSILGPFCLIDCAIIGFHISVQFAETGKIGIFKQYFTGLIHLYQIGLPEKIPGSFDNKRILY